MQAGGYCNAQRSQRAAKCACHAPDVPDALPAIYANEAAAMPRCWPTLKPPVATDQRIDFAISH
jgi:hypothetical protein